MTAITVHLSEELYQRAEEQAAERGESVEALMQNVLKEYLEEQENISLAPAEQWREELVNLARAARAEYIANGGELLDWEGLEREVAERRGGYRETEE